MTSCCTFRLKNQGVHAWIKTEKKKEIPWPESEFRQRPKRLNLASEDRETETEGEALKTR